MVGPPSGGKFQLKNTSLGGSLAFPNLQGLRFSWTESVNGRLRGKGREGECIGPASVGGQGVASQSPKRKVL